MMYSIKTRKIRRNKIRLHNWSVKEHQERGSDLISSGYVSRLSSQLEMRSEGHCFLHWISLMWKFQDVKFIKKSCVLLCSVRCLVPSERKAPLAPNHEIQESARSSSFHSLLGLLRLQLYLRRDQTKCEIGSRKQAGRSALEDRYRQNLIVVGPWRKTNFPLVWWIAFSCALMKRSWNCVWKVYGLSDLSSTIDQVIQYSLFARCLWNYYSRSV